MIRFLLVTIAVMLTACAAPIKNPQPKGKQLPKAGEHIPPPSFPVSEDLSTEEKRTTYLHYRLEDNCGNNGATGSFRLRPQACFSIYAPVCGCDGKTYGNACAANGEGMSVKSKGECSK